jgi:hypothetical protein
MTEIDRRSGVTGGLGQKAPCRLATTDNVSLDGLLVVDGVQTAADDRVLAYQQTDPRENGIWVVSEGLWTRAKDFDGNLDFVKGTEILVTSGDTNTLTRFVVASDDPVQVGVSNITFTLLGGSGTASDIGFTPAGGISSNNVQDAIEELDSEKEPADSTILKEVDIGVTILGYDADLEAIGSLSKTNGYTLQYVGDAWSLRSPAQVRATLDLEAGTDFLSPAAISDGYQAKNANLTAWSSFHPNSYLTTADAETTYQPIDDDLTDIAALTPNEGDVLLYSGGAWINQAVPEITGLEIGVDVQAYDPDLDAIAGLSPSNGDMIVRDSGAWVNKTPAQVRANLDLEIGTDVQAFNSNLSTWATLAPTANGQTLVTAADFAAMRSLLDLEAGTDFYSISAANAAFQSIDIDLTAIAALTTTAFGRSFLELANASAALALVGAEAADADILKADVDRASGSITAGYTATADNDGSKSSGTYTPDPAGGNLKRITNDGAFTLAAPTAGGDYTLIIQMTNGASAGVVALSGFAPNTLGGDELTTTTSHDFFLYITKLNGFATVVCRALQ